MKKASMFIKHKNLFGFMLTTKDKLYLGLRAIVLPLATLLPFALFAKVVPCNQIVGISAVSNECMTYSQPNSSWLIVIGFLLVMAVSFLRISGKSRREMRTFIYLQFILSVLVVAITVAAYLVMQNYSQVSAAQARSLQPMDTLFGLGIAKETFLLMVAVYLLLPILRWYKVIFSKNYFLGIKRKDLFQ